MSRNFDSKSLTRDQIVRRLTRRGWECRSDGTGPGSLFVLPSSRRCKVITLSIFPDWMLRSFFRKNFFTTEKWRSRTITLGSYTPEQFQKGPIAALTEELLSWTSIFYWPNTSWDRYRSCLLRGTRLRKKDGMKIPKEIDILIKTVFKKPRRNAVLAISFDPRKSTQALNSTALAVAHTSIDQWYANEDFSIAIECFHDGQAFFYISAEEHFQRILSQMKKKYEDWSGLRFDKVSKKLFLD